MPPKISKQVAELTNQSEHLTDIVKTFLPDWQERVQKTFQEELPGQPAPDAFAFLKPFLQLLEVQVEALNKAQNLFLKEESEDSIALQQRDEKVESVRSEMLKLKSLIGAVLGEQISDSLGLGGNILSASNPDRLVDVIATSIELLKPMTQFPSSAIPGVPLQKSTLNNNFQRLHSELDLVVKTSKREQTESSQVRIQRNKALGQVRSLLIFVNGFLSGFASYVGDEEGRKKVYLSKAKKRTQTEVEGDNPISETNDSSAE